MDDSIPEWIVEMQRPLNRESLVRERSQRPPQKTDGHPHLRSRFHHIGDPSPRPLTCQCGDDDRVGVDYFVGPRSDELSAAEGRQPCPPSRNASQSPPATTMTPIAAASHAHVSFTGETVRRQEGPGPIPLPRQPDEAALRQPRGYPLWRDPDVPEELWEEGAREIFEWLDL